MAKNKIACALSAAAVLGSGALVPSGVFADSIPNCGASDGLAVAGQISNASELEYVIANGVAEVKVAEDFTISCQPSIMSESLKIDLNGKTVNANAPWALDIETEGKTLTIEDSGEGGMINFNDAGIWVQNGANLTINSGTVNVLEGRGRGIVFRDGKLTIAGGTVHTNNGVSSTGSDGSKFYYPTIVVLNDAGNANIEITGGSIVAENGAALSVDGSSISMTGGSIRGGDNGVNLDDGAKFTMNGGEISASTWVVTAYNDTEFTMNGGSLNTTGLNSIGVSGNGTSNPENGNYGGNAKFNLNGGTINSNALGVYAPQVGGKTTLGSELTINAKECGVEVRAGELSVEGATITVDANAEYVFNPNGNGSTASGVAIAVAQHTTKQAIKATISDGNFTAPVVFGESNPQKNDEEDIARVELAITGGTFNATNGDPIVSSEDVVKFVSGGTYNKNLDSKYIAEGYVSAIDGDSYHYKVVDPNNMDNPADEVDTYIDEETGEEVKYIAPKEIDYGDWWIEDGGAEEGHVSATIEFGKTLVADRKAVLVAVETDTDGLTLDENKGGEMIGAVDIKMKDRNGKEIEVENNDLTVYFDIDAETHAKLAAYGKLYAVYFENGVEVERHEVYLSNPDEEGYWFSFNTSHLSTYAVIGVDEEEEPAEEEAATPDTGTVTAAGASASVAALMTAVAVGILTSIVSFAYLIRRKN